MDDMTFLFLFLILFHINFGGVIERGLWLDRKARENDDYWKG